ncbi:hypothetical protein V2O64_06640 [Verrucomicrobiaceae bacterium 227]
MHYIKYRSFARTMLLSSFVLISAFLAGLTTIVLVIILWQTGNEELMIPTAVSGGTFLVLALFQAILSGKTACQLCKTYILREINCSKNVKSRPLLGSYRLRVAITTIFKGSYRCPYCGEEFNIWAKPKMTQPAQGSTARTRKAGKSLPTRKH